LAQTSAARQAVVQHAAKAAEPSQFKQNIEEMRVRVEQAIERLNEQVTQNQRSLGFEIDQATDIVIVKVRNKETGEVVRQIAAEAFVRLAANSSGDKGGLFDEQF
jgi:flagellar protein FlaG